MPNFKRRQNLFFHTTAVVCFALISSCAKKSNVEDAQGDVQVQVGVQASPTAYDLQVVTLKGISKLSEVAGQYVKFFFAPGSSNNQLTGNAPRAQFVHSGNHFAPLDTISLQMATIYYHLQNLALFDKEVGADGVNHWPRSVGLETQIADSETVLSKNNAFYNGQTDSMMFVPFDRNELPITINAGIIAHEHFHSLFFKTVIIPGMQAQKIAHMTASNHGEDQSVSAGAKPAKSSQDASTEADDLAKKKAQTFNDTYLRGINEGFADFWGWVYTDDPEFMRWSLPDAQAGRTLNLSEDQEGFYYSKNAISSEIDMKTFGASDNDAQKNLVGFSYQLGTPYARFLKHLSALQSQAQQISLADAKKLTAQMLFNYLKDLSVSVKTLDEKQVLEPLSLFDFVAKLAGQGQFVRLDKASCEFITKYMNCETTQTHTCAQLDRKKMSTCQENAETQKDPKGSSFVIVKP